MLKKLTQNSNNKGSILAFTIIILGMMMVTAIGLISVAVIERKSSGATGRSTASFAIADTGLEMVLAEMNKSTVVTLDNLNDPPSILTCNASGTLTAGDFEITLYDGNGGSLDCFDNNVRVSAIRTIKSVGSGSQSVRAVQMDIPTDVMSGLVSRWELNSISSGNTPDSAGSNTGTVGGSVTVASNGKGGNALDFDGTTSTPGFINVSSLTDLSYSNGSISWWQYPHFAPNDNATHAFWASINMANGEISCQKFYWPGPPVINRIYCGWNDFSPTLDHRVILDAGSSNMPQNTWSHYVLTWENGGYTKLYYNGNLIDDNGGGTAVENFSAPFEIARQGNANYFDGLMDDVRVYNRALTGREVKMIYVATK